MKNKRWGLILKMCEETSFVSTNDIVEKLNISEATARRDLRDMEDNGLIVRSYGGARLSENVIQEKSMSLKSFLNIEDKNKIAKYAASLIKDGMIVYLDAGTSTLEMIDYINAINITIVTNGIPHLLKLSKKNIKTFVLSGFVKSNTEAVTGKETVNQISHLNFDLAFVGVNGIHPKTGFTTTEEYEGEGKKMAIRQSKKSYILADNSKFNKLCFVPFANFDEATVIIANKVDDFDFSLINYIEV